MGLSLLLPYSALGEDIHMDTFPRGPEPFAFLSSYHHMEWDAVIHIAGSTQLDSSKSAQILIEEISRILAGGES